MKKALAILLCLALLFALGACGKRNEITDSEYKAALTYYEEARAHYENGSYDAALQILTEAREKFGESALYDTLEADIRQAQNAPPTEPTTIVAPTTTEAPTTTSAPTTTVAPTTAAPAATAAEATEEVTKGKGTKVDISSRLGGLSPKEKLFYGDNCYAMDSANGIKVFWEAENISGKTINRYTVMIYFYDGVGDPAKDEISHRTFKGVRISHPIQPGGYLLVFDKVGYVPACEKVVIGEVTLEYADGTTETGWLGTEITRRNQSIL